MIKKLSKLSGSYFDQMTVFDQESQAKIKQYSKNFAQNDDDSCGCSIKGRTALIQMIEYGRNNEGKQIIKNPWVPWFGHQLLLTPIPIYFGILDYDCFGCAFMLSGMFVYSIGTIVSLKSSNVKYPRFMRHVDHTLKKQQILKDFDLDK